MKKCLVAIMLTLCLTVFAATEVPAGNVSGTWDLAGSPYNINGEIQILAGETLVIEAGVTVNFTGHHKFNVYGSIEATGSAGNEIIFTADNAVTGWHGMRFFDTTTTGQPLSQLVYCNFEYGRATGVSPDYQGGAIYCADSSELFIQYCSFANNSATTGGAFYLSNSAITAEFVEITGNVASGAGGAIYLNSSDINLSDAEITSNSSLYDGGAINCFNSDPVLNRVILASNITLWNGGGISAFNNSHPVLNKVTIAGNIAEQNGSALACLYNSTITMTNSIVWNNAYNGIYVEPGTAFAATYSNLAFSSGQSYFGEGCIQQDPMFVNPAAGDYSLSWENAPTPDETMSPCIDSGDPDGDPDPDGTIADMGAVYYPQVGIQGVVTLDGGTGSVQNVLITVTLTVPPNTAYTTNPDAGGNYFIDLPSGIYDFSAALAGYSTFTQAALDITQQLVTLNVTLTPPPPGFIVGEVEIEGIGNITSVLVGAGGISTNPYAVLDPISGDVLYYEYSLEISPGVYTVTASLAGYETQTEENIAVISGQQTTGVDFYLPLILNEGVIAGTVTLLGGAGDVQNVVITAGDESTSPAVDGTYEITILNGTYDVSASLEGYSSLTQQDVIVTAFLTTSGIDFDLIDSWEPVPGTQYTMSMFATVTYDGNFLDNSGSNQLAAFSWDASGLVEECRGTATWIAGDHYFWDCPFSLDGFWYITIVGDDNSGLENIWFDFYNSELGIIEDCNEMIFFDDGMYGAGFNLTIDSPITDVSYDLVENWNWVSFNRLPVNSHVSVVFDELDDVPDILQIKNQVSFAQYDGPSGLWVGGLTHTAYDTGYKINMLNAYDDFTFSGEKINPLIFPISIVEGYNWISYIPDTPLSLDDALQSLTIPLGSSVKTQTQSAVNYGEWIGDLQLMRPGKAYIFNWQQEVEDPVYLFYPPESAITRQEFTFENNSNLADWQLATGYESNMILMAEISADGKTICDDNSYSLGVFDDDGVCRSIGKLEDDFWYFTIAGDSPQPLHLRLFNSITQNTSSSSESLLYSPNSITGNPIEPMSFEFTAGENVPELPQSLMLKGNYPNPFNPSTVFSYALPYAGKVNLSIYNTRGQLVEVLVDQMQQPGDYDINWDASDFSSGIYYYKLSLGDRNVVNKCILMK
jgi:hypothetical protein